MAPHSNLLAAQGMRYDTEVKPKIRYSMVPAPHITAIFEKMTRVLTHTNDPSTEEMGPKAMTKAYKYLKTPTKHYSQMAKNPLPMTVDDPTMPPILKGEHKMFVNDFSQVQNGWTDKSLAQLNHCEWGQVAAMKHLKTLELKYKDHPELCVDLATLGKTMDLTGCNIGRAQESVASLRTNIVLQERDMYLAKIDRDVPNLLIKKARTQPVFNQKHLTGEVSKEMASSISVAGSVLAVSTVKAMVRPTARKGDRDS